MLTKLWADCTPLVGNCSEVHALHANGIFRSGIPGSMQLENANVETYLFQNGTIDACYLNVQAVINFAREKNLRLEHGARLSR